MPLSIYINTFLKSLSCKQATNDFGVVPAEELYLTNRIVSEIGEAQKVDCQELAVVRLAYVVVVGNGRCHLQILYLCHCNLANEFVNDSIYAF